VEEVYEWSQKISQSSYSFVQPCVKSGVAICRVSCLKKAICTNNWSIFSQVLGKMNKNNNMMRLYYLTVLLISFPTHLKKKSPNFAIFFSLGSVIS